MKSFTFLILLIGIALIGGVVGITKIAHYNYEKSYSQYWKLADKSSTIPAKQKYIAQFVTALEEGYAKRDFARNDAIWLKTPNNSFETNLEALKTLSLRLGEIQGMDPTSFQYNTAIQQITAQEQGEAGAMLHVFYGCYELQNYPIVWGWVGTILLVLGLVLVVCSLTVLGIIL